MSRPRCGMPSTADLDAVLHLVRGRGRGRVRVRVRVGVGVS